MLRAERKDMAKVSDLARVEARIDALDTKLGSRIEALDTKMSARLDTVVLELGKAFGRPASKAHNSSWLGSRTERSPLNCRSEPSNFSAAPLDAAYAMCNITHRVTKSTRTTGPNQEESSIMAKRKNTFTRFLSDIVDNTKDLADDLLDRAKSVESNAKDAVKDAVDGE